MARLESRNKNRVIVEELRIASNLWARMKGLLGTKSIESHQGLWIHRCDSIHTFFMNYSIDCIFLDKNMKVVSIIENIQPGRLILPQRKADSVVEVKGGQVARLDLTVGEELYVGA